MNTTELKALAEKATPGPWIAAGPSFGAEHAVYYEDVVVDREGDEDDTFQVCQSPTGLEEQSSNDMEFIGAANPAAILTLIADLESAQDERRALLVNEQNLREKAERWDFLAERMLAADFDYAGEGVQAIVFEMPAGFSASADAAQTVDAARAALAKAKDLKGTE